MSGTALEHYAKGSLIEQRRLMSCLVEQFLGHIDKLQLVSTQSEPSSPSNGTYVPNPMAALTNLLATDKRHSESSGTPVIQFLEASKGISPLIGMQAYRLVLELIYRDLACQLDAVVEKEANGHQLHKDLELGSFRTFPGSHRNVGAAHQSSARSR